MFVSPCGYSRAIWCGGQINGNHLRRRPRYAGLRRILRTFTNDRRAKKAISLCRRDDRAEDVAKKNDAIQSSQQRTQYCKSNVTLAVWQAVISCREAF